MATLIDIRDKVLRNVGLFIKQDLVEDENKLTARILQPFAAADMAWGLLQEVCEPVKGEYAVTQEEKQFYIRAKRLYTTRFFNAKTGLLYGGMTDDEINLFNDFMDKVNESVQHNMQILHYQLQNHMMSIKHSERERICKVLASEILALLAHDILDIDMKIKCQELKNISKLTNNIACKMLAKQGVAEVLFTDKMFEQTLTALFISITKVTTDGI